MYPILYRFPEWLPLLGDLPIRSFSVMVLTGVLVAWWWVGRALREQGVDESRAVDHLFRNALIFGFIGARLLYLAIHPEHYEDIVSLIAVWKGGIVSYGGFFGGALGAWLEALIQGIEHLNGKIKESKEHIGVIFNISYIIILQY